MPKDIYRSVASILVLRPVAVCEPNVCGTVYQILLLNKPRRRDSWQLPQGGIEWKESVVDAALRELNEEANIQKVKILKRSTSVYKYDFPASYRRVRPDHICGQRIEYVLALAPSNCAVLVDDHEIVGHVWALPEEIPRYLKRKEYCDFVKNLIREALLCISS